MTSIVTRSDMKFNLSFEHQKIYLEQEHSDSNLLRSDVKEVLLNYNISFNFHVNKVVKSIQICNEKSQTLIYNLKELGLTEIMYDYSQLTKVITEWNKLGLKS